MPPKLRRAALAAIARDTLGTLPPVVSRGPVRSSPARGMRWACKACGEIFTAYKPAERHVDEVHGAGRIECEITDNKGDK